MLYRKLWCSAVLLALAATAQAAETVKLKANESHLLPVPEAQSISLSDPRVVAATAVPNNGFQIHALGRGKATVTVKMKDGSTEELLVVVSGGKLPGKAALASARSRAVVFETPKPALYVGGGNPQVLYASPFEESRRWLLVGTGVGLTDLWTVYKDGTSEHVLVEVGPKRAPVDHTALTLASGAATTVPLTARPAQVSVADKQIAAVKVDRDGEAYVLKVTGVAVGVTDAFVSYGLDQPVMAWKVEVTAP